MNALNSFVERGGDATGGSARTSFGFPDRHASPGTANAVNTAIRQTQQGDGMTRRIMVC